MTGQPAVVAPTRPPPDAEAAAETLQQLDTLRGRTCRLRLLDGGLTNRNFHVRTDSGDEYVARFSSAKSALLSIDREAEFHNASAAAAAGVGPTVVEFAPDLGVLLVEWITGRTFADVDLDDDLQLARVADLCRQLHDGRRFAADFDVFDVQRGYLSVVTDLGFRLPAGYRDVEPQVHAIETALRESALATVPCHNDLLAANIIDDGQRLWLIDYEYSGNNDACFELGNIWSEAALGVERLEHLVACYFGAPSPVQVARARLFGVMAKYCWTLWASIQASISDADFDFWEWGTEKYARACLEFQSRELDDLISTVREPHRSEGAEPWPTPSS